MNKLNTMEKKQEELRYCLRCNTAEGEGYGMCESTCWGKTVTFGKYHRYRPLTDKELKENETRHQTALRYIQQAEKTNKIASKNKFNQDE